MILNTAFLPLAPSIVTPYSGAAPSVGAQGDVEMLTVALFARLEAKPGKGQELAARLLT